LNLHEGYKPVFVFVHCGRNFRIKMVVVMANNLQPKTMRALDGPSAFFESLSVLVGEFRGPGIETNSESAAVPDAVQHFLLHRIRKQLHPLIDLGNSGLDDDVVIFLDLI
jgi:hypothetical protein